MNHRNHAPRHISELPQPEHGMLHSDGLLWDIRDQLQQTIDSGDLSYDELTQYAAQLNRELTGAAPEVLTHHDLMPLQDQFRPGVALLYQLDTLGSDTYRLSTILPGVYLTAELWQHNGLLVPEPVLYIPVTHEQTRGTATNTYTDTQHVDDYARLPVVHYSQWCEAYGSALGDNIARYQQAYAAFRSAPLTQPASSNDFRQFSPRIRWPNHS